MIFGYMQVPGYESDSETLHVERSLLDYAQARGLNFVTFVFNFEPGACSGFTTLLDELRSTDAHYVLMPSLDHLAHHARLQRLRLDRLWHEAAATVLIPPPRVRVDA